MTKLDTFKAIGIVLLVLLVGASVIRGLEPDYEPTIQTAQAEIRQATIPVAQQDGVQVVDLSWGVLNYKPEVIEVKAGIPVRINADMNRLRGCYRSFIIRGMGVVGTFTEKKPYIDFFPEKTGEFAFSCSMNMARGKLLVT